MQTFCDGDCDDLSFIHYPLITIKNEETFLQAFASELLE